MLGDFISNITKVGLFGGKLKDASIIRELGIDCLIHDNLVNKLIVRTFEMS